MKKIALIFIVTFFFYHYADSQNNIPVKKYDNKRTYYSSRSDWRDTRRVGLQIGTFSEQFLNSNYLSSKYLDRKIGIEYNYLQLVYPFFFEVYFNTVAYNYSYTDPVYSYYTLTDTLRNRGAAICVNLFLPTFISKLDKYLAFYTGLGYQRNKITDAEAFSTEQTSFLKFAQPNWKFGVMIFFGENFYLRTDYRQTLFLHQKYSYRQLALTLGAAF